MSSHESLTLFDVLFKLTVHGLVARQLYRGFKQYLLPWMRNNLKETKEIMVALTKRYNHLIKEKLTKEKQLSDQTVAIGQFEEQVRLWHAVLEKKHYEAQEESKSRFDLLYRKRQLQALSYQEHCLKQQALEYIKQQAVPALQEEFKGAVGAGYITSVVERLEHEQDHVSAKAKS